MRLLRAADSPRMRRLRVVSLCLVWLAVGCSASFEESASYESLSVQHEFVCREIGVVWAGQDSWESSVETPRSWLYEPMTFDLKIQGDTALLVNGEVSVKLERQDSGDFSSLGCGIPDQWFDEEAGSADLRVPPLGRDAATAGA